MRPGKYQGQELCLSDPTAAYLRLKRGEINPEDYQAIESSCLPGAGACGVMGTGITMQIFSETVGIILSGTSILPGDGPEILAAARSAGRQIMKLQASGLASGRIITKSSIENGIRTVMACGGSTCAIFHIMALAAEIGEELCLEDFRQLSESTPLLCDVLPGGRYTVECFNLCGGVPGLLKELAPLLHQDCPTVSGLTIGEICAAFPGSGNPVIRSLATPLASTGGIGVLYGSLAPAGAVSKPHSVAPRLKHHRGPAKPYNSEKELCDAIMAGELEPGDVAIVRYAGPKGGPGMPCLYTSMWLLRGFGLDESVALVSDGRVSGTIKGAVVAHVAPEAADGGPIALVEKGDLVEIDLEEGRLDLLVPEDLLAARAAAWKPPHQEARGFLGFYRQHVQSTQKGAYLGGR
jgi:dihydroxy-acid dehydratase